MYEFLPGIIEIIPCATLNYTMARTELKPAELLSNISDPDSKLPQGLVEFFTNVLILI